jgi:hypothetical protein
MLESPNPVWHRGNCISVHAWKLEQESLRAQALASSNETKSLKISPPALSFSSVQISVGASFFFEKVLIFEYNPKSLHEKVFIIYNCNQ